MRTAFPTPDADCFRQLLETTACPFAGSTRYVIAPPWDVSQSIENNSLNAIAACDEVALQHGETELDMCVIALREPHALENTAGMSDALYRILGTIASTDPDRRPHFIDGIEAPDWDFVYRRQKFFVPVFAPFYPDNHPRWSRSRDVAFVILQSDKSFAARGITSRSKSRKRLTTEVEQEFRARGFTYQVDLVTHPLKAARYIKPVSQGDPIVRWWRR